MQSRNVAFVRGLLVVSGLAANFPASSMSAATVYVQTNLASDISGLAPNTDTKLKNPWGMSFGQTTPFCRPGDRQIDVV